MPQDPQSPQDFNSQLDAMVGGYAPPAAPQSAAAPKGKGPTSFFKGLLTNFAYGASQAGMKAAGLPTDLEQAQAVTQMQHARAQTQMIQAQTQQMGSMITMPNGVTMPYGIAVKTFPAYFRAQGTVEAAGINANSRKDVANINADSRENVADKKITPQMKLGQQYLDQLNSGDQAGAAQTLNSLHSLSSATSKPQTPNEIGLIIKAQNGDAEAKSALDTLQGNRIALAKERARGIGQARLYQLQKGVDPETGQSGFYTGFAIQDLERQGKHIVPAGALSAKDVVGVQQLQSEATPAIANIRQHLGAFDNPNDRAIFGRVIKDAGMPTRGGEASWMGNVLNQALKENLSPQGQNLAIGLSRLAETMGRMRSTLGLPATDQSMAISLGLLPGAATPNSQFAGKQVDQLEQMVKQAINIPAYKGVTGGVPSGVPYKKTGGQDLGAAPAGKAEGSSGTLPDGTRIVIRGGRIVKQ